VGRRNGWRVSVRVVTGQDRDAALGEFDGRRTAFEEALRRAPDAALRYRAPGDEYALGGLVVHVTQVLRHYVDVLEAIHTADWQDPTAPPSQPTPTEAALIRDGFGGDGRTEVLEQLRGAHNALVNAVRAEPSEWFSRKAPVTYDGSSEPYPTSPADVLGWVGDHYTEHTHQIADLISAWAAATR
jgi:hypothetical protein